MIQSDSCRVAGEEQTMQPGPLTSVLVVDDEPGIRSFLQRGLGKYFSLVETAENVERADELRQRCHFDLIIADIRLPGCNGVEWVTRLREQGTTTGVIFITAHADLESAVAALRAGAEDFIMKPFRMEQIVTAVKRYLEQKEIQRENFVLRRQVEQIYESAGLVGECDLIRGVCDVLKRVAPMPSTVLIEGESGTGKELAARAIHEWSGRNGSFVPINCGGMSAELLESELFGHVKGAFTGAQQAREGLFSYAKGGTLFLDEIGEMPLSMQVHLLRVLEEHKVRPVGSNREVPVDVRIIAATNRDLAEEVRQGRFREDLYYRLNVLSIRMPSLRERKEDIEVLARHFVHTLSTQLGVEPVPLDSRQLARLYAYHWPGNVRELRNVIERCLLLGSTPDRCLSHPVGVDDEVCEEEDDLLLETVEKRHILRVLDAQDGNKSAAARLLGVSRKTLERKMKAWGYA